MGVGCGVGRLLRDPRISRDPGIFSKSRFRDSQKSNPGIFRDFQKPLNDCVLRLSTPFNDQNNLLAPSGALIAIPTY